MLLRSYVRQLVLAPMISVLFSCIVASSISVTEHVPIDNNQQHQQRHLQSDDSLPENFPLCVGVRGNGFRVWSHFTSLAKIVESEFRPLDGMSGGSSGTLSMLLTESIHTNPLVDNDNLSNRAKVEYISFLLKSVEALHELNLDNLLYLDSNDPRSITYQMNAELEAKTSIMRNLRSGDATMERQSLRDIITMFDKYSASEKKRLLEIGINTMQPLVNPVIIELLTESPNAAAIANDILSNSDIANFSATEQAVFLRPGIINWRAIAEIVDNVASFYIGYAPVDLGEMKTILVECSEKAFAKEWPEIVNIRTASGKTCGERFQQLLTSFILARGVNSPKRISDPVGTKKFASIAQSSGIGSNGIPAYLVALEEYNNRDVKASWDIDFTNDIDFGYWGGTELMERAEQNMKEFTDLKSKKFRNLGRATWEYVIQRSPAEPGLSNAVSSNKGFYSTGGWADMVPSQVLRSIGCTNTMLVQRRGGVGDFSIDVPLLLGASETDIDAMYNLTSPGSSWTTSLNFADGSLCSDWDTCSLGNIRGLFHDGWIAPMVSSNATLRQNFDGPKVNLPGCTPLLAKQTTTNDVENNDDCPTGDFPKGGTPSSEKSSSTTGLLPTKHFWILAVIASYAFFLF